MVSLLLLVGCGLVPTTNSDIAEIRESKAVGANEFKFQILLTGTGRPLVHDPVSAIVTGPHEYQHEIFTNSIAGRLDSSSLVVRDVGDFATNLPMRGYIDISGDTLTVNLQWPDNRGYDFNGKFRIERKVVEAIPKVSTTKKAESRTTTAIENECYAKRQQLSAQEYCACLGMTLDLNSGVCSQGNKQFLRSISP
jgi:hypothetical protein